ncbi:MAG: NADP-dependent malic enzyme [Gemmatimonadetes bacterium]|nr:NADP-dependent malic enzyme [Gemmatimonadota bacterium]
MDARSKAALEYHTTGRPGKIEVIPTKALNTQRELSLAYTPGVAAPCLEIRDDPDAVFKYTARGNLVAVVTNGTAVLGLGNIGPSASKPVMEGKGVLFKKFAGIDVFDLEVGSEDPEDVIRFCELLEPTVGGINLEDIKAPDCFVIEKRLQETMDIPVFHDDQHGTAIIATAALLNALEVAGKKASKVRVVFSGAGASALATAEHFTRMGVTREHLMFVDSKGVIYEGREEGMNEYKARFAVSTDRRTLAEALEGADVLVGLSVKGLVTKEMVASMAERPIIFALANPDPEITPEEVAEVRDDAIMATGRSDYPNQVNNVLGFPFLFRGALDVRARAINHEMMIAATKALAELAKATVPQSVAVAYEGEVFEFGPEYLIPKPFDSRVLLAVAPAVAQAAMDSGVARETIDIARYEDRLKASLGPGGEVMRGLIDRARRRPMKVVLADGYNERVIRAAQEIVEDGIAVPVLIGREDKINEIAETHGLDLQGVEVVHPTVSDEVRHAYAEALYVSRKRKGLTRAEARSKMYQPSYFAGMMVRQGDADAVVGGIESHYAELIRPALEVIGRADGVRKVAAMYVVALRDRELLFFGDTAVNIDPDADTLTDIALLTAGFVEKLGIVPRIAMVSFSNFGSVRHPEAQKVRQAVMQVKELRPDIEIDGEMQADTALNTEILQSQYPFSDLKRAANVLIFPGLASANSAYKLLAELGGAEVIGPILLGMRHPVHFLQRGSTVEDIINLVTFASVDAQDRTAAS